MAYIDRFIFRFNSVSGKSVRIVIADDDYTGAAVERRLGGSPQLRCELSGNIRGMSLEIPAECKVDDEFAVLYTSDPTRFAVRVEMDNTVVWRGFVTPELYAAPWVDPPYDVQITATDGLGELKMKEWPAIGSRTLKEILDTVLGATGLALGIRMISAAANDIATAADLLTGTTVNLDHMAGKSYYDVLDGLLGSLHCTISQMDGAWLLVRETDVTALTSGGQVSDTTGRTYPVKAFGSSRSNDCWPVGRLTTEIVPAKSSVEVECPNKLAALITDPDMELNLWQTDGTWSAEDGGYYSLALGQNISQTASVANATRDADPGFRIKVSSRNTTPFDVGIMRLTVMATGRDPRSGSDKTLYLKEVTTQGRTQMEWVAEESHFDDGLEFPRTLDHQDCKEFVTDIFRLPTGFNPIKTITIRVSSGRNTVCVHSVNIECMSVYDKAVTRLLMDNGARGDESYSPLFADSFAGNKGNFLLSNSPKGVTGALVGTWSSEAIPSVPYGEWLAKDMALSVATPRLRMSGRLFTADALPALFYSNKGLSYITEEWDLDLIEDEADISLISLPAAALSTVSVSVIVEDNDGRKGTVSGGEIVSPKTGDSSSGSGYLDWFIAESYEADGETKYRLKLNPKYVGMYAEGWVSAGGVSEQGGGGGGTGYLRDLLDVNASMSPTQGQALVWDDALGKWTAGDVSVDLTPYERIANRVTTVSSSSNHSQYPTAKAVYDIVNTMLSSAMRFQGVTSTALVDGSTTNPVVVDGASYTATRGDVVVRSDVGLEYLWTGARWQQLGDETSYAKKTVTITGSGYLTGGGNLEASSQIDIADAVKTKIDNGATAFGYFTDGAANAAIKLKTPRTIWGQSFDGSADVSGNMTGVNSDNTTGIGAAIAIGCPAVSGLSAAGNGVGITMGISGGSYYTKIATVFEDNNPNHLQPALAFYTMYNSYEAGSEVERMRISANGNVGIGTAAPTYKLDVVGDSRASGKVYIGTSGGYLEVVNVGTTASPVYALKSSLPFFSDSWVSAGGVSSTGSGGGITGYLKDLLDVNGSMIPVDGQALVWDSSLGDNGRWTSKNVSVDLTPFERTSNRVTSISASSTDGQYPSARAVYNAMGSYLPLTGGTLNSAGTSSGATLPLRLLNPDPTGDTFIELSNGTDNIKFGLRGPYSSFGLTIVDPSNNYYKIWHEGNDGSGSGLNADLLDGRHNGDLYAKGLRDYEHHDYDTRRTSGNITYADAALHYYLATGFMTDSGRPGSDGYIMHLGWDNNRWDSQLWIAITDTAASQVGTHMKVRHHNNGADDSSWGDWYSVAMLDSNVASATKLQTARTIWGQNFDGTGNVSGAMTGVTTVNSFINAERGDSSVANLFLTNVYAPVDYAHIFVSNQDKSTTHRPLVLQNGYGNVGVGNPSPAYKLDVNGIIRGDRLIGTATGITETSLENEEFTYQATPVYDIADGYRIDRIKGNTIVSDGKLINNSAEAIETVGFNQWDEEWELGTFSSSGELFPTTSSIRTAHYIPVLPGKQLYFHNGGIDVYITVVFYDNARNMISVLYDSAGGIHDSSIVSCPTNAAYIKFGMAGAYGRIYNHDICINLSDPDRNGEYEPYWSARIALGLDSIKVKDSNGNILELNGLASAGGVYDEIVGKKLTDRFVRLDLGSATWARSGLSNANRDVYITPWPSEAKPPASTSTVANMICPIFTVVSEDVRWVPGNIGYSNGNGSLGITVSRGSYATVADFQAAMSGVMVYIERTTPATYELVSPVPLSGKIDGNGTMRVISDGPVAPFRGDITYGCNPGQMGADASSVKSYLDNMLEIKVVNGVPMLHTTLPFYSDSFVSAGGLSGTGGSGSGSSLRDLSDVQLPEIITTGSALVYNGEKWVQSDAAFVPQTRMVNGLELSSNISLSLGDLSNVNTAGASNGQSLVYYDGEWVPSGSGSGFLPLSGGSMTGTINMQTGSLTSTNTYKFTHTENGSEVFDAYFGANTNGLAAIYARNGIALRPTNASNRGLVVTGTDMTYNGATILKAAVNTPGMVQVSVVSAGDLTTILQIAESNTGISALDGKYRYYPVNISADNKLYVHIPWYSGSGSGGSGSSVAYVPSLTSGTLIGTLKIDGSSYGLYAPAGGSGSASWGATSKNTSPLTVGGTTKTVMLAGAATARDSSPTINTGGTTANRYYGVELSNDGKLFVNVPWIEGGGSTGSYLPIAGGTMTGTINSQSVIAKSNNAYDLGSSGKYYANTYTKKIYLDDGVYIYYDSTNRVIRVQGAGIAATGSVNAGGVSNT